MPSSGLPRDTIASEARAYNLEPTTAPAVKPAPTENGMSVVHFNSNPAYGIVRIERGNLGANSHRALRYVLGRPTTYVTNSTHAKLL